MTAGRVFLLSPASVVGARARIALRDEADFELARRLRSREGAELGDVFAFMSGLYFRGKLAYARAFARPPAGVPGVLVITAGSGLLEAERHVSRRHVERWSGVSIDVEDERYLRPLRRDARALARRLPSGCEVVLLGSISTDKYLAPLAEELGARLRYPLELVGRGDMSRGGLMLRCVREARELTYVDAATGPRHGKRPPKLSRTG